MKSIRDRIELTATDLVGHLNCRHLTSLNLEVARGVRAKPSHWDPFLEILRERGFRHEEAFIGHLRDTGLRVRAVDGIEIDEAAVEATLRAMEDGVDVVVQAALRNGRWAGRADVLRRVGTPSKFGGWSYEVVDTKLARETKGGTLLQLCLYSDLLEVSQGKQPEYAYVVAPWSNFEPQAFRVADYAAYYRRARTSAEAATVESCLDGAYPDPVVHCDICRWIEPCEKRRRADDHPSYVAGISRNQIKELSENGISTLAALADMPLPMPWKPKRGAAESLEKIREQARIQVEARRAGEPRFEMLEISPGFGLCALPEPSPGDVFLDLEGDPFVGQHGLEYLFGYVWRDANGEPVYAADWALDGSAEKRAFERFIDFVEERRTTFPELHIYHFAPYEPAALKKLMGRYATREEELDQLLRGLVFVDLYSVVRNAVRASVESYSIKKLEQFYSFCRTVELKSANVALASLSAALELDDAASVSAEEKRVVEGYNRDDCFSTEALRNWLEDRRNDLIAGGRSIQRPDPGKAAPREELSEKRKKTAELTARLLRDVPEAEQERSGSQQAQWILANILDWHYRESKAGWWEYFRLKALSAEELLDERPAVGGLIFVGEVPGSGRLPTHRYTFPQQETDIRPGKPLHQAGGERLGTIAAISAEDRTIDIRKTGQTVDLHPAAAYVHEHIGSDEQASALMRIGEFVAENGMEGEGRYQAARDALLRLGPRFGGQRIQAAGESTLDAALRIARAMESGVLPVQGPPGTGKSFTGARMICELVKSGKKVGIAANSHKVIRNLLDKVIEAAGELGMVVSCVQKPEGDSKEVGSAELMFAKNNQQLLAALASGQCAVAGATSFLWSTVDAEDVVDVLFVDEAAQMSLANVLAVSHAARRLILLGDPQQLDQPTQGSHPDGTGVSAMEHLLAGAQTIAPDQGLFLAETWRMHPDICAFDSELFYEGKLRSVPGCEKQAVLSDSPISGSGLVYVPVEHSGNKNVSIEEAEVVWRIVRAILESRSTYVDRNGYLKPLTADDILIITPYNAQVFEIQKYLPGARIGTVDKFQGQEAPVAIYSCATSTHADAPRGMEFLYSANRFNVAVSRAKCLAILVASPAVFEAECRTPRQMQLANAFCRYLELASSPYEQLGSAGM